MEVKVDWSGWDDALARMKAIEGDVSVKMIQGSLMTAMNKVKQDAKLNLINAGHVRTGLLLRSIDTMKVQSKSESWIGVRVGINPAIKGVDFRGNKAWPVKYGFLVHDKKTKYIEDAFNSNADDLMNTTLNSLERRLRKYEQL